MNRAIFEIMKANQLKKNNDFGGRNLLYKKGTLPKANKII